MTSASDLSALPPLREVISAHGLGARKSLGQNFLLDLNLTARIARAANIAPGATVFEIGPGPGGLTRALLSETQARKVIAVEKDRRCIEALQELVAASDDRLDVIEGDALKTDLTTLAAPPRAIVANLPYNVATPLLIGWLEQADDFDSFTLMFQKEVAGRIAAHPGTKAYGRLSVITQWLCEAREVFDIPPRAFTPAPKVTSTVVHITPRRNRADDVRFRTMERLTAAAFGQRRKMLRRSLKSLGPVAADMLEDAGIDPTARAEDIDIDGFVRMAQALQAAR